ncbi:hypothetical protein Hypma_005316 [Hypsizygus marmoreus]|uniref:Aminoglycoside phosphotransferase domain-containing protein n=1 Tax=Hypsizygus marmoreus TaxID=39966 RepID=A0A369K798_HYPMA|nr:hypothetical protein Hypma_005316 [Hypsizygus marmoreus]
MVVALGLCVWTPSKEALIESFLRLAASPTHVAQYHGTCGIQRQHPYSAGSRLDLQFLSTSSELSGPSHLSVQVIKPFEPFTTAIAVLVQPKSHIDAKALGLPSQFVLKLNDRRYSNREDFPQWSPNLECSLRSAIQRVKKERPYVDSIFDSSSSRKRLMIGRTFRLPFAESKSSLDEDDLAACLTDYAEGMALEHVDSLNMAEVRPDLDIPRADVERASENTLQIMKHLRDLCVMHNDIRPQNVLIQRQYPHNPVLIDFGSATIKPPKMSIAQWKAETLGVGVNEINDMRHDLTDLGLHIESALPMIPNEERGFASFNNIIETRSKEWRERFYDPLPVTGPPYIIKECYRRRCHWEFARWKLKPGAKTVKDHRYD